MTPVLLAGPTASGKSALALALAERLSATIVNADSQQVFRDWRVLTARPSAAEEARVAHRLYGYLPLDAATSVGWWLGEVADTLDALARQRRRAVIVGGTGLYFTALAEGLAAMPAVPPEVRARAEADLARLGTAGLAARLFAHDPATAQRIDPKNPARVRRAWEVWLATGRGLAAWQAETGPALVPEGPRIALMPDPKSLDDAIAARLQKMVETGALDEAAAVAARWPDAAARNRLPGMRALGAVELVAHVEGRLSLDEAVARATLATRRYAKRQRTWVRGRLPDWPRLDAPDPDAALALIAEADCA